MSFTANRAILPHDAAERARSATRLGTLPEWDLGDLYKAPDAPELKARCERERVLAHAALDFLEARTAKATIWLNDIRFGKYAGRVLARVTMASGADLSDQLLAAGLVRNYAGARRASWRSFWPGPANRALIAVRNDEPPRFRSEGT